MRPCILFWQIPTNVNEFMTLKGHEEYRRSHEFGWTMVTEGQFLEPPFKVAIVAQPLWFNSFYYHSFPNSNQNHLNIYHMNHISIIDISFTQNRYHVNINKITYKEYWYKHHKISLTTFYRGSSLHSIFKSTGGDVSWWLGHFLKGKGTRWK